MSDEVKDEPIKRRLRFAGEFLVAAGTMYAAFVREPTQAAHAGYDTTALAIRQLSEQVQEAHRQLADVRAYLEALEASAWPEPAAPSVVPIPAGSAATIVVNPGRPSKARTHPTAAVPGTPASPTAVVSPPTSASVTILVPPPPLPVPTSPPSPPASVSVPTFTQALENQK